MVFDFLFIAVDSEGIETEVVFVGAMNAAAEGGGEEDPAKFR